MRKRYAFIVLFCFGCNTQTPDTVHISLVNDKQSLKIVGVDPVIMQDISRDTASRWQTLFPVYRMPADTEMKDYQPAQPGSYKLKDNALIFTPDTPFSKKPTYFIRHYHYMENKSLLDYVKGKARAGEIPYTDLSFKQ